VWLLPGVINELSGDDIYCFRNCDCNLEDALVNRYHKPGVRARERYHKHVESPESVMLWNSCNSVADLLGKQIIGRRPWTDDMVSLSFTGAKRALYERAYRDMPAHYSNWWATVTPFVKIEKYTFYDKMDRIPRPIQPRTMIYRAYLSKFMKPIEKLMKKLILPGCRYPFMAKGASMPDLAKRYRDMWECFKSPVALSLDLSKFDGTIHPALKTMQNRFFRHFSRDKIFNQCLDANEADEYTVKLNGEYRTFKMGLCSGDPQTGCGNTYTMAVVCRAIFDWDIEVFANGDDTIVLMESDKLEQARCALEKFEYFGLDVKEESVAFDLYDTEWCQCKFTKTQNGDNWIRDFRKVLRTILSNVEYQPTRIVSLMSQIAEAELHQNPGIPIVAPVCAWIIDNFPKYKRMTSGHRKGKVALGAFQYDQHTITRGNKVGDIPLIRTPTNSDRYLFTKATQIGPSEQVAIENRIIDRLSHFRKLLKVDNIRVGQWDDISYQMHPTSW